MIKSEKGINITLIGKAQFKTPIQIQNISAINKLHDNYWKIFNIDFNEQKWQYLFSHMIECLARQLFLESIRYERNILKEIKHIKFTNLKLLQLRDNNISNIEDVCFLDCPQLSDLYLSNNKISRVNCLNKFAYFNISELELYNNLIYQISQLSRFRFYVEHYYSNFLLDGASYIYFTNSLQQKGPLMSDISKIFKFNLRVLKKVGILHKSRVQQSKILNMMHKKFPGMYFSE